MEKIKWAAPLLTLFLMPQLHAAENWQVVNCNPDVRCTSECRTWAYVRSYSSTTTPAGCILGGVYPSFDFAKRNADLISGRPPGVSMGQGFDHAFQEGERLRKNGDAYNAKLMYQNAVRKAATMEEFLYAGEALLAIGDSWNAIDALTRARDLSSRKVQFMLTGDALTKAGRTDLARDAYDRAAKATQ